MLSTIITGVVTVMSFATFDESASGSITYDAENTKDISFISYNKIVLHCSKYCSTKGISNFVKHDGFVSPTNIPATKGVGFKDSFTLQTMGHIHFLDELNNFNPSILIDKVNNVLSLSTDAFSNSYLTLPTLLLTPFNPNSTRSFIWVLKSK